MLRQQIEGPSVAGRRVLIVDDVSTTGSSPLTAARAAEAAGATVAGVALIADRGGVAIGTLEYHRAVVPSRPVKLVPRPLFLAGREELLAEVEARLSAGEGAGPRVVALCGLGGAGKTRSIQPCAPSSCRRKPRQALPSAVRAGCRVL